MKARLLKKILNNTGYTPCNSKKYISVGSPMCHDLINVSKDTLEIKYALDTFKEGRKSVEGRANGELAFIWDKLQELIDNGQIQDIINGTDDIENPLPVFYVEDGEIVESSTDKYDWPSVTINGDLMYKNTHFKTKEEAIKDGIEEYKYRIKTCEENIRDREKEIAERKSKLKKDKAILAKFEAMQYLP